MLKLYHWKQEYKLRRICSNYIIERNSKRVLNLSSLTWCYSGCSPICSAGFICVIVAKCFMFGKNAYAQTISLEPRVKVSYPTCSLT